MSQNFETGEPLSGHALLKLKLFTQNIIKIIALLPQMKHVRQIATQIAREGTGMSAIALRLCSNKALSTETHSISSHHHCNLMVEFQAVTLCEKEAVGNLQGQLEAKQSKSASVLRNYASKLPINFRAAMMTRNSEPTSGRSGCLLTGIERKKVRQSIFQKAYFQLRWRTGVFVVVLAYEIRQKRTGWQL